jgi:hypothetical protein
MIACMDDPTPWPDPAPGRAIGLVDWAGTALFVVVAVLATVLDDAIRYVAVGVSMSLFAIGTVTFLWAYAVALHRSREDEIGMGGLYLLAAPTAPREVRWSLDIALGLQAGLALATAAIRPYTTLAFGVLVPMFGLGLNGLWASRHGRFGPRLRRGDADGSAGNDPIGQNAPHG